MKVILILLSLLFLNQHKSILTQAESAWSDSSSRMVTMASDTTHSGKFRVRPFQLDIVPPSTGVQFYKNGMIFLSHTKAEGKVPERHLSFGSLRTYTSIIADTVPGNYMPFSITGADIFPTEATTFSEDFNTMYLSLIPDKASNEKIFRADYSPSGWKIVDKPLEICKGNYIYSHPCLSIDGTFMIFSSDLVGSSGGLDLYITRKEQEGWSNPENLGKHINSSGNELFASLDKNNNLYFSSDGHPGEGGYDVFIARFNGAGWEKPHSLSGKVNTMDDELAFTINRIDNKTAFFTTRVRSGKQRTQLNILDLNPCQATKDGLSLSESFFALASVDKAVHEAGKTVEPVKVASATGISETSNITSGKKTDVAQPPTVTKAAEDKKSVTSKSTSTLAAQSTEVKKETASQATPDPASTLDEAKKDEVVYRVQILANTRPVGSQTITVAGKNYKSFEYLYQGGYRTTIGEFSTLAEAVRLQNTCRQNGYSQAFVVAFKNNIRSTDPSLFK